MTAKRDSKNDHKPEESVDEKQSGALVVAAPAALPAGLVDDMDGFEGAGTSSNADDNIVPFMGLLQDLSPEVKKRDPAYVEGAEAGFILNKASRQIWGPEDELIVQPVAFQRALVEWVPRDNGGGFVSRTEFKDGVPLADQMKDIGAKEQPDPRDSSGRKMMWRNAKGNDIIDTRYHFVNVMHPDGRLEPAVLSFSSTGHTSSRAWMTLMNQNKIKNPKSGSLVTPPSWFRKYLCRAQEKSNASGTWFVLVFSDRGWIEDAAVRAVAKEFYTSVMSGTVTAATDEQGVGGATPEGTDLPI